MLHSARAPDNPALFEVTPSDLPPELIQHIDDGCDYAAIVTTWPAFIASTSAIDDELLIEDFAIIHSLYNRLVAAGVRFGPAFVQMMDEMREECRYSDEDDNVDEMDTEDTIRCECPRCESVRAWRHARAGIPYRSPARHHVRSGTPDYGAGRQRGAA